MPAVRSTKAPSTTRGAPWNAPGTKAFFDLASGAVIHGPATMPQASYDTRVNDQKIEIRSRH
jgi:hypothetical protein